LARTLHHPSPQDDVNMPTLSERLGFTYIPDELHYTAPALQSWLPVLRRHRASWLTLRASLARAVPEFFIQSLLEAGITPIIHITDPLSPDHLPELRPLFASYARWGVRHVVVMDKPNCRQSWSNSSWAKGHLVDQFLDRVIPLLSMQQACGLTPVYPPLQPGGDYWDLAFLQASIDGMLRRDQRALADQLELAAYGWSFGHPASWGAGGLTRWPDPLPYALPPSSEDQRGVHAADWYDSMACASLGHSVPILVIAGGDLPQDDAPIDAKRNADIASLLPDDGFPDSLRCFCFHCLSAAAGDADQAMAWYPTPSSPSESADRLLEMLPPVGKSGKDEAARPIQHYLLLPEPQGPSALADWATIGEFVLAVRPTVGFSPEEAKLARQVTLAGKDIPHTTEIGLRQAGCAVHRLNLPSPGPAGANDDRDQ
jgi:hypothetical protein